MRPCKRRRANTVPWSARQQCRTSASATTIHWISPVPTDRCLPPALKWKNHVGVMGMQKMWPGIWKTTLAKVSEFGQRNIGGLGSCSSRQTLSFLLDKLTRSDCYDPCAYTNSKAVCQLVRQTQALLLISGRSNAEMRTQEAAAVFAGNIDRDRMRKTRCDCLYAGQKN